MRRVCAGLFEPEEEEEEKAVYGYGMSQQVKGTRV